MFKIRKRKEQKAPEVADEAVNENVCVEPVDTTETDNDENQELAEPAETDKRDEPVEDSEPDEPVEDTEGDESVETDEPEDSVDSEVSGESTAPVRFVLKDTLDDWLKDKEISDNVRESMQLAVSMIESAVNDNAIDEALMEMLFRGADYDRAIADAAEAGEIRGRNARIEELMTEESEGDGVPHPDTGGGSFKTGRLPSIFDLARNA